MIFRLTGDFLVCVVRYLATNVQNQCRLAPLTDSLAQWYALLRQACRQRFNSAGRPTFSLWQGYKARLWQCNSLHAVERRVPRRAHTVERRVWRVRGAAQICFFKKLNVCISHLCTYIPNGRHHVCTERRVPPCAAGRGCTDSCSSKI